ncbi:unnamed protein product [Lupinus luteus]|uniref:Uncharacterized protein n=1 Tax=Lupinus luteus TaxID=3873 RepID=A0AAV1WYM6_LUPLU
MTSSSDSSSPKKSLHSLTQNPPTSECDQTIRVVDDATTKEGGSNAEDGKKEGSENHANEPSKVLDTGEKDEGEKSVVGEKRKFIPIDDLFIDLRDGLPPQREQHQEEGGNGNKRVKLDEGSSGEAELQGMDKKGLMHQAKSEFDYKSVSQEEGGEICENVKVEEGFPNEVARPMELDLNQKIEDEEDIEEKLKKEVEEAIVEEAENENKMEVAHSEDKNEANPSDEKEKNKEVMVFAASEVESAQKNEEVETSLKYDAAATEKLEVDVETSEAPLIKQKNDEVEVEAQPSEATFVKQQNDEVEADAEPAEASLIDQKNDDANRIVRNIDLNELPPEYEEDN